MGNFVQPTKEELNKFLSEAVSEQEEIGLQKTMIYRKRLSAYFQTEFIADTVINLIENSKFVSFDSERSRKFIDKKRPVFRLAVDFNKETLEIYPNREVELIVAHGAKSFDVYTNEGKRVVKNIIDHKLSIVNGEIIDPFLTVLYEELLKIESEEMRSEREEIYRLLPDLKDLKHFFLPAIFKLSAESGSGKIVVLEYIV